MDVRRTSVRQTSDRLQQTSDGRPSDVRRTSVRTSVRIDVRTDVHTAVRTDVRRTLGQGNGTILKIAPPFSATRRRAEPRGTACSAEFFRGAVWGGGAVFFISKNLPLKGKFFEMVSWGGLGGLAPLRNLRYPCLAPRGGLGGFAPQESPLITRALPPQRPCLAPVPCPQFFFVQFFSSKFVSSEFFRPNFFRPNFCSSEFFRPIFYVQPPTEKTLANVR